jgi:hypothetical protein
VVSDFLWLRDGDEVAETPEGQCYSQKRERRRGCVESANVGLEKLVGGVFGEDRMQRTRPIASPMMKTRVWSATVWGDVRKKKPRVI